MGKRTLKEVESLYSEIENIAKSLKIDYSEMTCYMDDKSEITDVFFDIKVNGKPSNIKYTEYKELREFVKENKINEIKIETDGRPFKSNYKGLVYPAYTMVIKGKPLVCEKSLYSFVLYIKYTDREHFKYISSFNHIQELNDKDMEEAKKNIKYLEKIGYKNETGDKEYNMEFLKTLGFNNIGDYIEDNFTRITGAKYLEERIGGVFSFFDTFEVEKIKVNFTLNENGWLNGISDFIIYAKDNPENMTYEEFNTIQKRSITLIYNDKEIMNYRLDTRDFRNVVFCSMDVFPNKIIKHIKGIKGEGLEITLKKLEESGYTLDL